MANINLGRQSCPLPEITDEHHLITFSAKEAGNPDQILQIHPVNNKAFALHQQNLYRSGLT